MDRGVQGERAPRHTPGRSLDRAIARGYNAPMAIQRTLLGLIAAVAVLGFAFAAVSTSDFASHLDRQVHGIHCSLIPGGGTLDTRGTSGCHVTLMSPYSSVMRDSVWGGIPVALPAMGVFAFLVFAALSVLFLGKARDVRALTGLTLATSIPFLTSLVMGWISLSQLDAACKLCIGIYVTSTLAFVLAIVALVRAPKLAAAPPRTESADETIRDDDMSTDPVDAVAATLEAPTPKLKLASASDMDRRIHARKLARRGLDQPSDAPLSWAVVGLAALLGIAFVTLPMMAYAAGAPDFDRFVGACGTLENREGEGEVLVAIGPQSRDVEMIEVLDPLCPSCRGFEARFGAHRAAEEVSRRALLFPLDSECNWMVSEAVHPGACVLSEAILCADDDAEEVLAWAFEHQDELRRSHEDGASAEEASAAITRAVRERFPAIADCIGTPRVRARLNRALRFAVQNELPVLTPQVYVGGTRLCDEDTDLGLDYVLSRLLDREEGGAR